MAEQQKPVAPAQRHRAAEETRVQAARAQLHHARSRREGHRQSEVRGRLPRRWHGLHQADAEPAPTRAGSQHRCVCRAGHARRARHPHRQGFAGAAAASGTAPAAARPLAPPGYSACSRQVQPLRQQQQRPQPVPPRVRLRHPRPAPRLRRPQLQVVAALLPPPAPAAGAAPATRLPPPPMPPEFALTDEPVYEGEPILAIAADSEELAAGSD